MIKKLYYQIVVLLLMTLISFGYLSKSECAFASDNYPEKKIDVIVGFGPGGGTDIFARTATKILNEKGIVEQPLIVSNNPGAIGAIALNYIASRPNDPYNLLFIPSIGTPIITGDAGCEYSDFTFLARLCAECSMIVVGADSRFDSFEELMKEIKENPDQVSAAGAASIGAEAFQIYSLGKLVNSSFNYIPFDSGTEATIALLGGKVDVGLVNPSEGAEQIKAGKLKGLAILADERVEFLPDVPTAKELGYDFSFYMDRNVWGPAAISSEVVDYWDNAFAQLVETEEWKKYVKENGMVNAYLSSLEYSEYLKKAVADYTEFLKNREVLK